MQGLTSTQAGCLDALRRLTVNGVPPSYDALAADLGIAKCTVSRLLNELKDRGAVDWTPFKARTLRVLDDQFSRADLARMSDQALRRVIGEAEQLLRERGAA